MNEVTPKQFKKSDLTEAVSLSIQVGLDKKGEDIVVLDLSGISSFTDIFVIMHGNSSRQNSAIAESLQRELKKVKRTPLSREGVKNAEWILLDYGDFIVHIFSKETREYYALEGLWSDAPKITY